MLSSKAIEDFQRLYKQDFGKEISKQEAMERGTKLVELMKIICKTPKQEKDKLSPLKSNP